MMEKQLAGILFLDIRDYSELNLDELETYHECVMPALYNIVINKDSKEANNYLYKNSWGDGIVLINQDYYRLVSVGLELRDYFKNSKYERVVDKSGKEKLELRTKELLPRIAVHFGEFKQCEDFFKDGNICYGPTLFLPARIEPITPAGRVWVTDRVKDFVKDRQKQQPGGRQIEFVEQGDRRLAKNFKVEKIYEAYWKKGETKPSIFKNETEIDTEGIYQQPEEYEDIDQKTTKRVKAFIMKDFNGKKISVCSREPKNPKCPVKVKSMRVIFDVSRNGRAAVEECQISYWVKAIIESTKPLVPYLKGDKKGIGFSSHFQNLCRDIVQFFKCLEDFKREQHQEWPDMSQWPISFINWRIANNKRTNISQCEAFVPWISNIKSHYEAIRSSGLKIKDVTPDNVPAEIADCIYNVSNHAEPLSLHLQDVGRNRAFIVDNILTEELKKFNRFAFAGHLKNIISQIADKLRSNDVPSAWSK